MPSIVAEPKFENTGLEPKNHPIGWRGEEIARSCHVTTQLRSNGEGGYLRTVRRRSKLACTTTTHHRHVIKSSNSYETSKVEDQSKSEGLTIEVNCPPQYQREHSERDYNCTKDKINGPSKPKLSEIAPRSFLRIGQHRNEHQTNVGAVTRIPICNTNNNNMQDDSVCFRPSKMQKVIPTSLITMDKTKHRSKTQLVDNIEANDTSYEQFITDEGNRKLRRKILRSHNYQKTVTKTNVESNENVGSTQIVNYENSNEDHQNSFPTCYTDNLKSRTRRERKEMGNDHSTSALPIKIEICKDWCRRPRNNTKILTTNELTTIDTQNISTIFNSSTQTSNKYELRRNCKPIEIIGPLATSNINSCSARVSSCNKFSHNEDNPPSRHKPYKYINNLPPSHRLFPTVTSILEYPKKNLEQSEQEFTAESYSTVSTDEYAVNSKSFRHIETERIHSPVTNCEIKNHSSLPSVTFRKISQHDLGRWKNEENWRHEESSSEDFPSQLKYFPSKNSQTCNLTGYKELPLSGCNRRPSKEKIISPALYSSSISDSREESLTDEDRSMNEFVMKQSKQKELASQYYFGIPTAKVRTRSKKEIDNITTSSSSFDLPSIDKQTSEKLISQQDRSNYQESWSGSEHQTMQWSSTNENSDENSFFKETRTRKGPIEVCFSIKTHCQTRTIAEEPRGKEANKEDRNKKNFSVGKYQDKTWGRSASENENEITFSREVKSSKEPMELLFSVTSLEQQRILRENARNEQQSGQLTKNQGRVKNLVEERKYSMKENRVEGEEQTAVSDRKRKKNSKEIKEYPVEVQFSVKPLRKEKAEQNNYEQNKELEKPIHSQVGVKHVVKKEETFEDIFIRKLATLRKTTSDSKLSNTSKDLLIFERPKRDERLIPTVTKQPSINDERTINSANLSEKSIRQTENSRRTDNLFKITTKFTDTKGSKKSIFNPPLLNPNSDSYFSKVETQIINDLAETKESLSKIVTIKSTTNESTDVKKERKSYYEIPFNSAEFSINEHSAFKHPSSKLFQETDVTKPCVTKEINLLKTNVTGICNKFSTNFKSAGISKDEIITTEHSTERSMNKNFSIKYPIKIEESKDIQNTLKITDITSPLKSPIYMKQLLNKTLNTQPSLKLEPDIEEINVKKSNISSNICNPFKDHSESNAKKTQRHLLSSLDTNSEFLQQNENLPKGSIHRSEFKLKLNDYGSTVKDKQVSTINQNALICYLLPQPSHRGFKVKSWKEEILINRMLLDVEKIDESTKNEMKEYGTANRFLKIASTDWAQSTDYNYFQLTSENDSHACEKTTPKSQGKVFCSKAMETENTASQRTRDQHINSLKTSMKKRSNAEMADNSSRLLHPTNNPSKPNKNHLRLHSMEKELKRNKPNIQCIYETSL